MLALLLLLLSADARQAAEAAQRWREAREAALIRRYAEFLSIPNTAADSAGLRRNAAFIAEMFREAGASAELVEVEGAAPAVYAEIASSGARRTLLVYAHYDGQPVIPERWAGHGPFEPVLRTAPVEAGGRLLPLEQQKYERDWRLFARSASDDKVSIFALWAALMALRDSGLRPQSNLRFLFEGEEEQGSPHLPALLAKLGGRLRGDVWLICDGSVHQSGAQRIVLGARGVATVDITVYGARRGCTAGTTATGRRTRPCSWRGCLPR